MSAPTPTAKKSKRTRPARRPRTGETRSVTYRAYPTAHQVRGFDELLMWQRRLYNAALEERRGAWKLEGRSVTKFDQYGQLSGERGDGWEWLERFGVGVCRGTLTRLDEAFSHFFRRVKAGDTPGFPRFQGEGRFDSVQWEGMKGWKLTRAGDGTYGRLYVQGVGHVKVKLHRWFATPAEGGTAEPRKIVVRRRGVGRRQRWEVTVFWRGVQVARPNPTGRKAGVDVGVAVLAAVATAEPDGKDGGVELVPNPKHLTTKLAELEAAQQALASCKKTGRRDGAGRRNKAKARVTRLHRQVRDARKDHNHQLSRRLVDSFDEVFFEDLTIANMTRSAAGTLEAPGSNVAAKSGLNRSILDAGWGQLVSFTIYKAASAGRVVSKVKAAHTSQTCASCGYTDAASRVTRDHFCCTACGHVDHADAYAARVVLAVGEGRLTVKPPRKRRQQKKNTRPGSGHPPVTAGRDAA